jgi:hypothetical protein
MTSAKAIGPQGIQTPEHLRDPDPWTVVSLVIASVAMVAQLAQLRLQSLDTVRPQSGLNQQTRIPFEKLKDEIASAIRNVEKLVRLLSRAGGGAALNSPFVFGESQLMLDRPDITLYRELVAQISLNAGSLNQWCLVIIEIDTEFAAQIGSEISVKISSIQQRINDFFLKRLSNETVLEVCIDFLKTFSGILDRLEHSARN